MALPVFSSDALSSVAYATEEMMVVLAIAGTAAFRLVPWLSLAVATLLVIVIASYRHTVRAYPDGGGAYRVATDNLGTLPGLIGAAALLFDYILTVAVSIAAGTAAILSAAPALQSARVPIAIGLVLVMMLANLRGLRESGLLFAVPAYGFLVVMLAMVGTGLLRCVAGCPAVPFEVEQAAAGGAGDGSVATLSLFFVLRAFATGATALTGVEAIADGVPAFKPPRARNAAWALGALGVCSVTLFMGIGVLASAIPGVGAFHELERTVTSLIAAAVFGAASPGFYAVQVVTAAILVLAANTAFADFPRLASFLAEDRYLPRQLRERGDRLVFSNGVLLLSGGAILLLAAAQASVTRLVGLYVVGVFTAFTLSQAGMVVHTLRSRRPGWRVAVAVSGIGAITTGVILVIVAIVKFSTGAWITLIVIPVLVVAMRGVRRHYARFDEAVRAAPATRQPAKALHAVLVEDRVDAATAAAVSYVRGIGPATFEGVAATGARAAMLERWEQVAPDVPLVEEPPSLRRGAAASMRAGVERFAADHRDGFVVAVIPETRSESAVDVLRHHRVAQRLKAQLVGSGDVIVANVVAPQGGPGPYQVADPVQHHVVVLVSEVHAPTMRAIAYAQSLGATSVRALSVNLTGAKSSHLLREWVRAGVGVPLELVDSPFRSIVDSVRDVIRRDLRPDGQHTVVTAVVPEVIVPRWWQRGFHNQTALLLKAALLFERGVVMTSVPSRLLPVPKASDHGPAVAAQRDPRAPEPVTRG